MFNLTPPAARLSAADLCPDALTLSVWRAVSVGAPVKSAESFTCLFTGRTFPAGTVAQEVSLDDGRVGLRPVGVWGSPSTIHGDELFSEVRFDLSTLSEIIARPDCHKVTLLSKSGEPTTFTRDGAAWRKWGRSKTSADAIVTLSKRAAAFAAWS